MKHLKDYILLMCVSLRFLSDIAQVIKCNGSLLCGTIFLKPAPKFDCTIREGAIVFSNVLNSKRQSYQCLQNKNPLSGCKVSTLFSLCPCLLMPPSNPYILLVLTDYCDVTLQKIEQINTKLSTECKYQSIRKRLSTNTYI